MKPFPFAVCILAHDHLSEGVTSAVAIFWLIWIHFPLTTLQTFSRGFFASFLLEPAIFLQIFIKAPLTQFLLQFFSWLVDKIVESLGSGNFFLGLGVNLILYFEDVAKWLVDVSASPVIFFMCVVKVVEKECSGRFKVQFELLDFLVQFTDVPEERVSLRRNHIESVNKVIHVAHLAPPIQKIIQYSNSSRNIKKQELQPHNHPHRKSISIPHLYPQHHPQHHLQPHTQLQNLFPPTSPLPCFQSLQQAYNSNLKTNGMRKLSQDLQFLNDFQTDQVDIAKIREQRQLVTKIQCSFQKKDEQIQKLKSLLQKYQQYQQKYTSLKVQLTERSHIMAKKDNECRLLKKQIDELLREQDQYNSKIKQYQIQRQSMIRERYLMETAHKEIETTFKEYQSQFRKRENALAFDLEKAYQQIKQANTRIDQLELIAQEKKDLQSKFKNQQRIASESRQQTPTPNSKRKTEDNDSLLQQLTRLKGELLCKQQELTANRVLNYQLTIEYDSAINNICTLQSELSTYRKDNNEMRKILSLMRQQEKCKEIQDKYTLKNKTTQFVTPMSDCEESACEEEELSTQKNYFTKTNDNVTIQT